MSVKKINGYVGLFFHTFNKNGLFEHQGVVEHQLPDGRLVCTLFDWAMGEENGQETCDLEQTKRWNFYTSSEHMRSYAAANRKP